MIRVLAYSAGRSDISRWVPFIEDLKNNNKIYLKFILSDSHFDKEFGYTYKIFKKLFSNFKNKNHITRQTTTQRINKDAIEFDKITSNNKYDFVILLGDRFEILNIAYMATIKNIPIIHIYGGAITIGAIDNQIRNAVTKLSHFHLVACNLYKNRLIKMGEKENRIKTIGISSLNKMIKLKNHYSKVQLEKILDIKFEHKVSIITVHPVTLHPNESIEMVKNIFKVVKDLKLTAIFTYPNKDQGNEEIIKEINKFCLKNSKNTKFIKIFNDDIFPSLLNNIDIMIGNSSSGIVESASFKLPVINIGTRQSGKLIPKNVINSNNKYNNIKKKVEYGLSNGFKNRIKLIINPYQVKTKTDISKILMKLTKIDNLLIKS